MRRAGDMLHRKRVTALQRAVERLPVHSRHAMLQGLGEDPIIAGAYSIGPARCPGFAAYRRGARTGYREFATAWDRYARGRGVRRARNADVATLVALLRTSLATELARDQDGGASSNGASANGASANGASANGASANGASANGAAPEPSEPPARLSG